MRRDWELVRAILIKIEEQPDTATRLVARHFPEWPEVEVNYHLRLMIEAGWIEGKCNSLNPASCFAASLTWSGHEFLDTVRSDTVWGRIKKRIQDASLDLSFVAIVAAGKAVIASVLT